MRSEKCQGKNTWVFVGMIRSLDFIRSAMGVWYDLICDFKDHSGLCVANSLQCGQSGSSKGFKETWFSTSRHDGVGCVKAVLLLKTIIKIWINFKTI